MNTMKELFHDTFRYVVWSKDEFNFRKNDAAIKGIPVFFILIASVMVNFLQIPNSMMSYASFVFLVLLYVVGRKARIRITFHPNKIYVRIDEVIFLIFENIITYLVLPLFVGLLISVTNVIRLAFNMILKLSSTIKDKISDNFANNEK